MAQASTRNQEYWRPANPNVARLIDPPSTETLCWNCGMEYSPAARFCHMCGSPRDPGPHVEPSRPQTVSVARKTERRSTSSPPMPLTSIVCFALGIACVIGAGLMGAIYRTDTLVDWQAVQTWRIEWLLAALAALLAGVLLKKAQ
ncbi:MAG TPA: zinc ribbon domain-containing protein [Candidatus Bathyarchaeia archaeon]|nr:zinc ribbon domain-containing protein [Candidatus Bathyarchaeia archaeon]